MPRQKPEQVASLEALPAQQRLLFEHYRDQTPIAQVAEAYNNLMGAKITTMGIKSKTTQLRNNQPIVAALMQPKPTADTNPEADHSRPQEAGPVSGKRKREGEAEEEGKEEDAVDAARKRAKPDSAPEATIGGSAQRDDPPASKDVSEHPLPESEKLSIPAVRAADHDGDQAPSSKPAETETKSVSETIEAPQPQPPQVTEIIEPTAGSPETTSEDELDFINFKVPGSGQATANAANQSAIEEDTSEPKLPSKSELHVPPVPQSKVTENPISQHTALEGPRTSQDVQNNSLKTTVATNGTDTTAAVARADQPEAPSLEGLTQSQLRGIYIPPRYTELPYNAACEKKLHYIHKEFDIFPNEVRKEFEDIQLSIDTITAMIFDYISFEDRQKYRHPFAQHAATQIFEVMQMITGGAADDVDRALKRWLDEENKGVNASHMSKIYANTLGSLLLNAILTNMVWMPTLSTQLGIPRLIDNDTHFIEWKRLAELGRLEVCMARFKWRDTCRAILESDAVQARCTELQNKIMTIYEDVVGYIGPTTQQRLQPEAERRVLFNCIRRAIDLKCKLELASNKFQVSWDVKSNNTLDLSTMKPLSMVPASSTKETTPLHRNRVRVAVTPMLYVQEPVNGNEDGLDAVERQWLVDSLPVDEVAKHAFMEPRLLSPATVVMWDGPVRQPSVPAQ